MSSFGSDDLNGNGRKKEENADVMNDMFSAFSSGWNTLTEKVVESTADLSKKGYYHLWLLSFIIIIIII
jgi:hypothetical protein